MNQVRDIGKLAMILLALTLGFWLLCGCAAQNSGIADEQVNAAAVLMPVVKSANDFIGKISAEATAQIQATAELAANQIKTSQQAGRDAISKVSTGTPWYANLIGFVGLLYWQWRVGYRPGTWEKKAQYTRRNGNGCNHN